MTQQNSLKALCGLALQRNRQRNRDATMPEKPRNFDTENMHQKLREVALEMDGSSDHQPATAEFWVLAFTPLGQPIRVRANNAEHAAWIQRMNPEPNGALMAKK